MKNSNRCPKCESTDIIRIAEREGIFCHGNTVAGSTPRIPVVRFVCAACGFSEEWIEEDLSRRQLKQYHSKKK